MAWGRPTAIGGAFALAMGTLVPSCDFNSTTCGPFPHRTTVTMLDSNSGRPRWTRDVDLRYSDVLVADDANVYVSNGGHTVIALDAATGHQRWRRALATGLTAPPRTNQSSVQNASPKPTLILGPITIGHTDNSRLVARAPTGALLWVYPQHANGEQFGSLVAVDATRALAFGRRAVLIDVSGHGRTAGPIAGADRNVQRVAVNASGIAVLEADAEYGCK